MFVVWSRGVPQRGAAGAPVLTWCLLALALALQAVQAAAPALPPDLVSIVAAARLVSDPGQGLFAPWQLWTGMLVHGGWLALLLAGVAFAILGGALERRLGTRWFALVVLALAPVGVALPLVAGVATPALGLGPLAVGCAGGLLALAPGAPLVVDLWWWGVVVVGRRRYRLGLHWLLAGYIALEAWRLGGLPRSGLEALAPVFLPLHAASLVLVIGAGHLLARSFAGLHDHAALAPLARLARGDEPLERAGAVLAACEHPPVPQLAALGERALREGHRDAAALVLARLTVVAPDCATAQRLRAWLAGLEG